MKELFEKYLGPAYGSNIPINIVEHGACDRFGLNDPKACRDCLYKTSYFYKSCGDYRVSEHYSESTVRWFILEDIFQFYNKTPLSLGGCCDVFMYSNNTILLCDMTCARPIYLEDHENNHEKINGKRDVAYRQLQDSIKKLYGCPEINNLISQVPNRIALLSMRKKQFAVEDQELDAVKFMSPFFSMTDEINSDRIVFYDMGCGFKFGVQEYPCIYNWE